MTLNFRSRQIQDKTISDLGETVYQLQSISKFYSCQVLFLALMNYIVSPGPS